MNISLTRVLYKIFVKGFYKVHSGQLLFFFVTFLSYFFYIQVLKDSFLSFEEKLLHNFKLVLTTINHPIMATLVCFLFSIYACKGIMYVQAELKRESNFFLFYSANAYDKNAQLRSWFWVQFAIMFPIIFFCGFSILIGFSFGYYLSPLLILSFVISLIAFAAFYYTNITTQLIQSFRGSLAANWTKNLRKPLYTLFVYYVFDRLKITLLISKILSIIVVLFLCFLLADFKTYQLTQLVALVIAFSNAMLVFESYCFEKYYLNFQLNFPLAKGIVYRNWLLSFLLLLIPEIIVLSLSGAFETIEAVSALIYVVVVMLLFKSTLLLTRFDSKKYIYFLFGAFIFSFISIQFSVFHIMAGIYLLISYLIFQRFYYRQKT